jgi:hypothetical protein
MSKLRRDDWTFLGRSINSDAYLLEDGIIVIVPDDDVRETGDTARDNLALQARCWKQTGMGGGGVVILMDPVLEQDADARAVYANEAGSVGTRCFALVGESFFAMAQSSIYTGLSRPSVPLEVFRSLDEALPWLRKQLSDSDGA